MTIKKEIIIPMVQSKDDKAAKLYMTIKKLIIIPTVQSKHDMILCWAYLAVGSHIFFYSSIL